MKKYQAIAMRVVTFSQEDVITASVLSEEISDHVIFEDRF